MWIDPNTGIVLRTHSEIRAYRNNVSFSENISEEDILFVGLLPVVASPKPDYHPAYQRLVELNPTQKSSGAYQQAWAVQDISQEELQQAHAVFAERLKTEIVSMTQVKLDAFAQTRNYDGILSAATYATSSNPQFRAEGQYALQARDQTWSKLYEILEEIKSGLRPIPASFAEILSELPLLEWPQ